ncbi:MAG: hypothetical protein IJI35_15370 [Kiritimatiellae bacterium]|nr:hypothetical protein [Kiritimatiellia bacterium]
MKKRKLVGAGLLLLMGGCASVEMAQYTVTSFAEVPLKDKAKIKIVSNGDGLDAVERSLKSGFAEKGGFSVVDEGADYWFVLNGLSDYGTSKPQKVVSVVKREDANGGTETFAETTRNLAGAAKGVSVAVYEAKTLAPVHYFEIPIYSGDNTAKAVRGKDAYDAAFSKEVVERVMDAFITQQKQVETPIPLEADSGLRDAFMKGGEDFAKGDKAAYVPFLERYKRLGVVSLAKLFEQLRTKTYEGPDANKILGNYYLYLLVKEAMTLNPEKLVEIKNEQLMILEASDAKGVAEAVPVALARLEYKLANVGE